MRLWTIHPRYLDAKGLVALWREALLARAVLAGKTTGYRNHPQLIRFRQHADPEGAMAVYLQAVYAESRRRGYRFDRAKLPPRAVAAPIRETQGQLELEWHHLLNKLKVRNPGLHSEYLHVTPDAHPLFEIVPGKPRDWEQALDRTTPGPNSEGP